MQSGGGREKEPELSFICKRSWKAPLPLFSITGGCWGEEKNSSQSLKDVNFEIATVARQFISLKAVSSRVTAARDAEVSRNNAQASRVLGNLAVPSSGHSGKRRSRSLLRRLCESAGTHIRMEIIRRLKTGPLRHFLSVTSLCTALLRVRREAGGERINDTALQ